MPRSCLPDSTRGVERLEEWPVHVYPTRPQRPLRRVTSNRTPTLAQVCLPIRRQRLRPRSVIRHRIRVLRIRVLLVLCRREDIVECVSRVRACLANLELLLRPIIGVPMVKTCVLPLRRLGEMREALRTVAPCGSEGLLV